MGLNDHADKSSYPSYKKGKLSGKQVLLGLATFVAVMVTLIFVMGW
jgi:hypothetical protein